jgi:hypothetical protein
VVVHGDLHREDGPAVENADGTREWWLNGYKVREADYEATRARLLDERAAAAVGDVAISSARRSRTSALAG